MWDPEWAKAHCMKKWVILYDSYIMRYSKTVYVYCYLVKMDGNPQNLENSWIHTRCNGSNGVIPCHELHQEQDYSTWQYFLQLYFVIWFDLLWNLIKWFYLKSIFRDAEWILRIHRNEHVILRLWSEHPYLYLSKTEKILTK